MAHAEQKNYLNRIKTKFPKYFQNSKVLEIGSYNVNGTIREMFENSIYTGIDVVSGKCVDIVCSGHEFRSTEKYDMVVSCECLEHNVFWKETFLNMIDLTKSEGMVLFTCATDGRKEHGTTRTKPKDSPSCSLYGDYYRNLSVKDFQDINLKYFFTEHEFEVNNKSHDLYFYGIKI